MPTTFEVEVPGARLAVEVHDVGDHWGTGIDQTSTRLPLLLLNPAVGDRRVWQRIVPTWSTTRRVITFDQRGAGESTWDPADPFDPVADALAVLDACGAERAVVVGNSFGGAVGLHLALDHTDRVESLLLVAPYVTGAPWPDLDDHDLIPPAALALDEACDEAVEQGDVALAVQLSTQLWLDGWASDRPRVDQQARNLFESMLRRIVTAPATQPTFLAEPVWPRRDQLAVPTLLVLGGRDLPYANVRAAELVEAAGGTCVTLPDAAHLPQLEAHLRFSAATAEFLTESG